VRLFGAGDVQTPRIDESQLYEKARLIAVDVLVIKFVSAKFGDDYGRYLQRLAARRDAQKKIIDLHPVPESRDEFE
jgi:hypothetical protein